MALLLLIARLIVGLGLAAHGSQKLFGWFGGYGIKGTGGYFESVGYRPGAFFALGAGLSEFVGGLLIALGFLGALGPSLGIMVMLVAIFTIHVKNGFFATNNGWELPGVYIASNLTFLAVRFGSYSIDSAIRFTALSSRRATLVLLLAAIVLAIINLLMRRPPQPQQQAAQ